MVKMMMRLPPQHSLEWKICTSAPSGTGSSGSYRMNLRYVAGMLKTESKKQAVINISVFICC